MSHSAIGKNQLCGSSGVQAQRRRERRRGEAGFGGHKGCGGGKEVWGSRWWERARRGGWTFMESMRVGGWRVFTTAQCQHGCSAAARSSSRFVHCTTQMGTTPVHGCGRGQLSTPPLYTAGRKAAPCSLWPWSSYHIPTTSSLLSSTCQAITNKPSRTSPLLVQVLIIPINSEVCNIRGSCTTQVICKIHPADLPGDATALVLPSGKKTGGTESWVKQLASCNDRFNWNWFKKKQLGDHNSFNNLLPVDLSKFPLWIIILPVAQHFYIHSFLLCLRFIRG